MRRTWESDGHHALGCNGFFGDDGDGELEVGLLEDEIQIGDLAGKADQLDDRDVIEVDGVGVDISFAGSCISSDFFVAMTFATWDPVPSSNSS